jgi:hypothetical protein
MKIRARPSGGSFDGELSIELSRFLSEAESSLSQSPERAREAMHAARALISSEPEGPARRSAEERLAALTLALGDPLGDQIRGAARGDPRPLWLTLLLNQRLYPLPGLLLMLLTLVHPRAWERVQVATRGGGVTTAYRAQVLLLALIALVVYALSFSEYFAEYVAHGRLGMRRPSEQEKGLAVVFTRVGLLAIFSLICILSFREVWFG